MYIYSTLSEFSCFQKTIARTQTTRPQCIIQHLQICSRLSCDDHTFWCFCAWPSTQSMCATGTDAWLSHRVVRRPSDMDFRRHQITTIMNCTVGALLASNGTAASVANAVTPGIFHSHDQMNTAANMDKVLWWERISRALILRCV